VVEADGLAQASKITLSILVKAVEKEGLTFLKGNRERMKIEGESGTFVSKVAHAPRWHLYVAATQGSFLTSNFPRKLLLNIDNSVVPVNYAVRACKALQMLPAMQSYHKLMVHGSLKGCKGWRPEVAHNLLTAHRLCVCDAEAAKRKERKEAYWVKLPRPYASPSACNASPLTACPSQRYTCRRCTRAARRSP